MNAFYPTLISRASRRSGDCDGKTPMRNNNLMILAGFRLRQHRVSAANASHIDNQCSLNRGCRHPALSPYFTTNYAYAVSFGCRSYEHGESSRLSLPLRAGPSPALFWLGRNTFAPFIPILILLCGPSIQYQHGHDKSNNNRKQNPVKQHGLLACLAARASAPPRPFTGYRNSASGAGRLVSGRW